MDMMNIMGELAVLFQSNNALHAIFGGDYPDDPLKLHQIVARAIVIYVAGVAIVRIGKSRVISRLTPLDVILGFVLGSLLSRGITGHASLSGTTAASAALVAAHWLLTWLACRWHWFGDLIKGHAYVVVKDGEPLHDYMLHSHLSMHDLEEQLRLKGIDDLKQVRLAYKERNGEVSALKRKEPARVVEIAVQEGVQIVRLQLE